jgi:hypothetical protein
MTKITNWSCMILKRQFKKKSNKKKNPHPTQAQKSNNKLTMHFSLFTSDQNTPNHIHETLVHRLCYSQSWKSLSRNFPAFNSTIIHLLQKLKRLPHACHAVAWLERESCLPIATEAGVEGAMSSKVARASTAMAGTYAPHQWSCSKEKYILTLADFPGLISV